MYYMLVFIIFDMIYRGHHYVLYVVVVDECATIDLSNLLQSIYLTRSLCNISYSIILYSVSPKRRTNL